MPPINDELLRRVKLAAEKMTIKNHGLPNVSGDILALVYWAEEIRRAQRLSVQDSWKYGGAIG